MMTTDLLKMTAGADRLNLGDGTCLRLLSAMEVLEVRRQARALAKEDGEAALCSNACLLARALEKRGKPIYPSGEAVLSSLSVSQIQRLARRWAEFDREENPGPKESKGRLADLKKAWSTRLRNAFAGVCSAILERFPRRRVRRK